MRNRKKVVHGSLTRKGEMQTGSPPPHPPAPGVTKAAAVAEIRSSGTVKVFLRGGGQDPDRLRPVWKEGTGVYKDLCFRKTKRPQTKTKGNLTPTPAQELGPPPQTGWEEVTGTGTGAQPLGARGLLAAAGRWPGRRMPDNEEGICAGAIGGRSLTCGNGCLG